MGTPLTRYLRSPQCPAGWGPTGLYQGPQPAVLNVFAQGLLRSSNYQGLYPPKPTGPYKLYWLETCCYVHYFRSGFKLGVTLFDTGWWATYSAFFVWPLPPQHGSGTWTYDRFYHDTLDPYLTTLPFLPRMSIGGLWKAGTIYILYPGRPQ